MIWHTHRGSRPSRGGDFMQSNSTDLGVREYDISVRTVRGVEPWPELEDDIRARYEAWCECGEVIDL